MSDLVEAAIEAAARAPEAARPTKAVTLASVQASVRTTISAILGALTGLILAFAGLAAIGRAQQVILAIPAIPAAVAIQHYIVAEHVLFQAAATPGSLLALELRTTARLDSQALRIVILRQGDEPVTPLPDGRKRLWLDHERRPGR